MDALTPFMSAAGLSWASGLRLYATLALAGLAHSLGWVQLPSALAVLANPWVIGGTGVLAALEFGVDKIPGLDSLWDSVHTFLKIPAGIALAAGSAYGLGEHWVLLAGLLGGSLAASTAVAKSSTRLLVNTSPEPFTNWGTSLAEDSLWALSMAWMLANPATFVVVLLVLIALTIYLLMWVRRALQRVGKAFSSVFNQFSSKV
jgi:Domain of unknown function (DUF4126)